MAERDIEILTDRYYEVVKQCFETERLWDKAIKKFPPMAIRSAVRKIVERFLKRDEDPDQFDFCEIFTEQLLEYDSIDAFIDFLDKRGYIPPDPERELAELLNYLEMQASSIGYRLVKEKEWARITGRYEALQEEVRKLRAEKKMLEARVKELEKALEEYKQRGRIKITDFKKKIVQEAKPPPPALPSPPKPKTISDVMPWEEFLRRIKDFLVHEGIPAPLADRIVTEEEKYLREVYETGHIIELNAMLYKLLEYIANEYIPVRFIVIPAIALADQGVSVREPQPTWFWRYYGRPPIAFVYPRFVEWAMSIERSGYKVRYTLVPITHKTHFIYNPGDDPNKILVAVDKEQPLIALSSREALVYYFDTDARELVYYRYPACKILLR